MRGKVLWLEFPTRLGLVRARSEARDHAVFDSVRGVGKRLHPSKDQEEDDSGTGLTAFNSDGYVWVK